MSCNCDKELSKMINAAPDESEIIDQQVEQIEEQQAVLETKNVAIRECVTNTAAADQKAYLEGPKLADIQVLWPEVPGELGPVQIVFGTNPPYGEIGYEYSIKNWGYWQENLVPTPPVPPEVVPGPPDPPYYSRYAYVPQINWDDDQLIIDWCADWDFGNDYITHPVEIGATYGLEPLIDMYDKAKSTLLGNQSKIEALVDVFKKFL